MSTWKKKLIKSEIGNTEKQGKTQEMSKFCEFHFFKFNFILFLSFFLLMGVGRNEYVWWGEGFFKKKKRKEDTKILWIINMHEK